MNLYRISQNTNNGYDTYDSAVVCADDERDARSIHPSAFAEFGDTFSSWCSSPDEVTVRLVGVAAEGIERGVVCASFNAG